MQPVPHVYQYPPRYKRNWCGPAFTAGLLMAYGFAVTIYQVAEWMSANGGLTNFINIRQAAYTGGLPTFYHPNADLAWHREMTRDRPTCALVDGRKLRHGLWAAHFITVREVGPLYTWINDSIETTGPTRYPTAQFEAAINTPSMWAKPTPEFPNGRFNNPLQGLAPTKPLTRNLKAEILALLELL
jgi:hypothetical protein